MIYFFIDGLLKENIKIRGYKSDRATSASAWTEGMWKEAVVTCLEKQTGTEERRTNLSQGNGSTNTHFNQRPSEHQLLICLSLRSAAPVCCFLSRNVQLLLDRILFLLKVPPVMP